MGEMRRATRERFKQFRNEASLFSQEMASELNLTRDIAKTADLNLRITKTIFAKWSLEVLVMLFSLKQAGFEELRKAMRPISTRVLSDKLHALENHNLIKRTVLDTWPPRTTYELTDKGLTVARLGEPVILYLRFEEGLL